MRIEIVTGSSGVGAAGASGQALSVTTGLEKVAARSGSAGHEAEAEVPKAAQAAGQPEVEAAIRSIEDAVREKNISLTFSRDEQTGTMVMELVDQHTGEPVLQIPSEAQLRLVEVLGKLQGNIINQKA